MVRNVTRSALAALSVEASAAEKPRNRGAVEQSALVDGREQSLVTNPDGTFQLFRIGDSVSARNTHAAIYDALRLVKGL
jgi:hypothetical protein